MPRLTQLPGNAGFGLRALSLLVAGFLLQAWPHSSWLWHGRRLHTSVGRGFVQGWPAAVDGSGVGALGELHRMQERLQEGFQELGSHPQHAGSGAAFHSHESVEIGPSGEVGNERHLQDAARRGSGVATGPNPASPAGGAPSAQAVMDCPREGRLSGDGDPWGPCLRGTSLAGMGAPDSEEEAQSPLSASLRADSYVQLETRAFARRALPVVSVANPADWVGNPGDSPIWLQQPRRGRLVAAFIDGVPVQSGAFVSSSLLPPGRHTLSGLWEDSILGSVRVMARDSDADSAETRPQSAGNPQPPLHTLNVHRFRWVPPSMLEAVRRVRPFAVHIDVPGPGRPFGLQDPMGDLPHFRLGKRGAANLEARVPAANDNLDSAPGDGPSVAPLTLVFLIPSDRSFPHGPVRHSCGMAGDFLQLAGSEPVFPSGETRLLEGLLDDGLAPELHEINSGEGFSGAGFFANGVCGCFQPPAVVQESMQGYAIASLRDVSTGQGRTRPSAKCSVFKSHVVRRLVHLAPPVGPPEAVDGPAHVSVPHERVASILALRLPPLTSAVRDRIRSVAKAVLSARFRTDNTTADRPVILAAEGEHNVSRVGALLWGHHGVPLVVPRGPFNASSMRLCSTDERSTVLDHSRRPDAPSLQVVTTEAPLSGGGDVVSAHCKEWPVRFALHFPPAGGWKTPNPSGGAGSGDSRLPVVAIPTSFARIWNIRLDSVLNRLVTNDPRILQHFTNVVQAMENADDGAALSTRDQVMYSSTISSLMSMHSLFCPFNVAWFRMRIPLAQVAASRMIAERNWKDSMAAQGIEPCSSAFKSGIAFAERLADAARALENRREALIQAGRHADADAVECIAEDKVCKLGQMFQLFRTQPTKLPQHWILAVSTAGDKTTIWDGNHRSVAMMAAMVWESGPENLAHLKKLVAGGADPFMDPTSMFKGDGVECVPGSRLAIDPTFSNPRVFGLHCLVDAVLGVSDAFDDDIVPNELFCSNGVQNQLQAQQALAAGKQYRIEGKITQ